MRLYMATKFLLVILQGTSRCVYALTTNLYTSIKHNHVLLSRMTTYTYYVLKIPSSCNHYKKFKVRYSTVQIIFIIWDLIRLTKVTQCKIYIKSYKNR